MLVYLYKWEHTWIVWGFSEDVTFIMNISKQIYFFRVSIIFSSNWYFRRMGMSAKTWLTNGIWQKIKWAYAVLRTIIESYSSSLLHWICLSLLFWYTTELSTYRWDWFRYLWLWVSFREWFLSVYIARSISYGGYPSILSVGRFLHIHTKFPMDLRSVSDRYKNSVQI